MNHDSRRLGIPSRFRLFGTRSSKHIANSFAQVIPKQRQLLQRKTMESRYFVKGSQALANSRKPMELPLQGNDPLVARRLPALIDGYCQMARADKILCPRHDEDYHKDGGYRRRHHAFRRLVERIVLRADGAERFWVHAGRQVRGVSDLLKGAPGKLRVILDYADHVHADQCDCDIGLGLAIYFEAAWKG